MRHSRNWRRYIRFWGPDVDADIDEELCFHLEARIAEYERRGYSTEDAARLTRERVGELTDVRARLRRHDKQKLTIYRSREHMSFFAQDVRYGLRKLRQAPGFSFAVVAVLALGIGANTAIYSAIDAAVFRPLPFPHAEQLLSLDGLSVPFRMGLPEGPQGAAWLSDAQRLPVFSSVAAYAMGGFNLEAGSEEQRATVALVSTDFFRTVKRYPQLGRTFTAEEESAGGPHAVLLSHRLWQQQFGSDPNVVGRTVQLNTRPYTIAGVMPPAFHYPNDPDVWIPLPLPVTGDLFEAFTNFIDFKYVARLAPTASVASAGSALRSLERQYPAWKYVNDTSAAGVAKPLQTALLSKDWRQPLVVLMSAAALVLLIACANVANLLLSRATTRQRELAIRSVLGATRGRILRQLTVESLMLSLSGAAAGAGLGFLAMRALRVLMPAGLLAVAPPEVDTRVLAFTLSVALLVGIGVGIWPALESTRGDAGQTIKAGGAHGATERGGRLVRGTLVVAEIALALVLLIGSLLMIQSFRALVNTNTGMRPEHVFTAHVTLPKAKYPQSQQAVFYTTVLTALRSAPGISAAGAVNTLPLGGQGGIGVQVTSPESTHSDSASANPGTGTFPQYMMVLPGYFATMGIPILRGRDLETSDDGRMSVVIVNRALADRFWPGQEPIGKHLDFGQKPALVVGVVANVRTYDLSEAPAPQMYMPMLASGNADANFVVRGALTAEGFAARLRDAVHATDPHQLIYDGRMMEDVISGSVSPRRTNTLLLSVFGAIAIALAGIGVYSVLAYGVSRRIREFGVRTALGAERRDVLRLVMREGILLASIGAAIGIAASIALSKLIASLLYQVSPHDLRIFVLAPIALMAIALAATLVPALRATRVDPMEALRAE